MKEINHLNNKVGTKILSSENKLIIAANPLLNAIPWIKYTKNCDNSSELRKYLIDEVCRFEVISQQAGLSYETIVSARYCLCTALDEAASLTPWGRNCVWSANGLLVTFHNETWGGEKFFQLLARLSQNPRENLVILELINYCLLLGFEGRYRVVDNGRTQLETIKQRLWQMIYDIKKKLPVELSLHPQDKGVPQKKVFSTVHLWTSSVLLCFIACVFYILLNWKLDIQTNPVLARIYGITLPEVNVVASKHTSQSLLLNILRQDINSGLITIHDNEGKSRVILKGDGLFKSGSSDVQKKYVPVIERMAASITNGNNDITIIGYTDNVPIHRSKYASNDELSLARANAVEVLLQSKLQKKINMKIEGRGEKDPVVPNSTPENRALNRRVEIVITEKTK